MLALGERREQLLSEILQQEDRVAQYSVRRRPTSATPPPRCGLTARGRCLFLQKENARRKHNFIPLIYAMLRALAERGRLHV